MRSAVPVRRVKIRFGIVVLLLLFPGLAGVGSARIPGARPIYILPQHVSAEREISRRSCDYWALTLKNIHDQIEFDIRVPNCVQGFRPTPCSQHRTRVCEILSLEERVDNDYLVVEVSSRISQGPRDSCPRPLKERMRFQLRGPRSSPINDKLERTWQLGHATLADTLVDHTKAHMLRSTGP
jgi:hypothetical protein